MESRGFLLYLTYENPKMEIEDTYCEAFEGLFARICITAKDERRLERAAYGATALPSTVFGESERGMK